MRRKILVFTTLIFILAFASCNKKEAGNLNEAQESVSEKKNPDMENKGAENENSESMPKEGTEVSEGDRNEIQGEDLNREESMLILSNMADDTSREEVKNALGAFIKKENVDRFISLVSDFNETIEKVSLNDGFQAQSSPEYDLGKMIDLWFAKKGDFIGTNCRINTFMLLKDEIEIGEAEYDDSALFMDSDAINVGRLFDEKELEDFKRLFSRVKTEDTKDIEVHAKKMKEHFSKIKFDEEAAMISVVLHDNLDDNYLFIGHSGVSVPMKEGYLFVEKLAFDQPYQAVIFKTKDEIYDYLLDKYKDYCDETTAKPFIMENGSLAKY